MPCHFCKATVACQEIWLAEEARMAASSGSSSPLTAPSVPITKAWLWVYEPSAGPGTASVKPGVNMNADSTASPPHYLPASPAPGKAALWGITLPFITVSGQSLRAARRQRCLITEVTRTDGAGSLPGRH